MSPHQKSSGVNAHAAEPMVSLPMYPRAGRAVHQQLYLNIRDFLAHRGLQVPRQLTWSLPPETSWRNPGLLLGQTCAYPLLRHLGDEVCVVGRFSYAIEGLKPGCYRTAFLSHASDSQDPNAPMVGAFAYNCRDSLSGYQSWYLQFNKTPTGQGVWTGSHDRSIWLVAKKQVRFAAVDLVSLMLLAQQQPWLLAHIRTMALGPQLPSLPLITSRRGAADRLPLLRQALHEACQSSNYSIRHTLRIHSFLPCDRDDYVGCTSLQSIVNTKI